MRGWALDFLTLAHMIIRSEWSLLMWDHVDLTAAHTFILARLNPLHTFHTDARRLDIGVRPLVNSTLISWVFALHRGPHTTFWALRSLVLLLWKVILVSKLVKVAISVADLVSMRCISWHSVLIIFAFTIEDVFSYRTYLLRRKLIALTSDVHQLLEQLLFCDFLAVNEFFKQNV